MSKTKLFLGILSLALVILTSAACKRANRGLLSPISIKPTATTIPTQPSPTPVPTPTPLGTPTISATYSPTYTISSTKTVSETATPTPSQSNTLTQSETYTFSGTITPTMTQSNTVTASPTYSPTYTISSTKTVSETATPTPTQSNTLTKSNTMTASPTYSHTPTVSNTDTATYTVTVTFTHTPTGTFTATISPTPTNTPSSTATPTGTPTNTISPTATPPAPVFVNCTTDDSTYLSSLPATGYRDVGDSSFFIALCNGWILIGDKTANEVVVLHAPTGTVDKTYSLTSDPGEMAYDPATGLLFVTLATDLAIAKINLVTDAQSAIVTTDFALYLTLGSSSKIWAGLDDNNTSPNEPLLIIDAVTGSIDKTWVGDYNGYLAYDVPGEQLFIGERGFSDLDRYSYNPGTQILTPLQSVNDCSNGQDVAVSNAGDRVVFPCGGGNGAGYTIWDFDSSDLTNVPGVWVTGAYPRSAKFSPNDLYFLATNGNELQIFDANPGYALLQEWTFTWIDGEHVDWSRGGSMAFGLDADTGDSKIFWAKYP